MARSGRRCKDFVAVSGCREPIDPDALIDLFRDDFEPGLLLSPGHRTAHCVRLPALRALEIAQNGFTEKVFKAAENGETVECALVLMSQWRAELPKLLS